eukprot:8581481-Ditylum_brightwellii.AAC.1
MSLYIHFSVQEGPLGYKGTSRGDYNKVLVGPAPYYFGLLPLDGQCLSGRWHGTMAAPVQMRGC